MSDVIALSCMAIFGLAILFAMVLGPPLYAAYRGFTWYYWVVGGGMFGLVILATLPSPKKKGLSAEEREAARKYGNRAGMALSTLSIGITVGGIFWNIADQMLAAYQAKKGIVWESKYHPVQVVYESPWQLSGSSRDLKEQANASFVETENGLSYHVFLSAPVEEGLGPLEVRIELFRKAIVDGNPEIEFMDQTEVPFHGKSYLRLRFKVQDSELGMLSMQYFILPPDSRTVVSLSYPWTDSVASAELPPAIKAFDAGVKLNDEVSKAAAR